MSPLYVDTHLGTIWWRPRRLVVDGDGITWGRTRVDYGTITALAYWVTITALARGCEFRLHSGRSKVHIGFRAPNDETYASYQRTVAALQHHVEPRLLRELLSAIDAGEEVTVAALRLSANGLRSGPTVPWSSIVAIKEPPQRHPRVPMGDLLVFAATDRGTMKPVADIYYSRPNGPLLPALIQTCVSRYGAN